MGRLYFKHRAAIAWNSLPGRIQEGPSIPSFLKELNENKDILMKISYAKESSMIINKNDDFLFLSIHHNEFT